jgi:hypothetical protein
MASSIASASSSWSFYFRGGSFKGTLLRSIGAFLVLAAMLKCWSLINGSSSGILGPRWLWFLVAGFEIALGGFLMLGAASPSTWTMTLCTFVIFPIIGVWEVHHGAHSCGCFGAVRVPAMVELAADLVVVGALCSCRPTFTRSSAKVIAIAASLPILGGLGTVFVQWHSLPVSLASASSHSVKSDEAVLLEPTEWINKDFPLFNFMDGPERFTHGNWRMLFIHDDCAECLAAIPDFLRHTPEIPVGGYDQQYLGLVELPPYDSSRWPGTIKEAVVSHLSGNKRWFMHTPTEVWLRDGIVTRVDSVVARN